MARKPEGPQRGLNRREARVVLRGVTASEESGIVTKPKLLVTRVLGATAIERARHDYDTDLNETNSCVERLGWVRAAAIDKFCCQLPR